jgi:hypothetical protein
MEGAKGEGGRRYRLQVMVTDITATKNGIGIVIDKSLKYGVLDIKR